MAILWSARQKILLLLLTGLTLGLTRSPRRYFKILKNIPRAWQEIDRRALYRAVREFKRERLVGLVEKKDGTLEMGLHESGKKAAFKY